MTVALVANIARPISSAISTAFSADSYGLLSSYGLLGASASPDAVIEALFANSEVGAWYDPSDLTTMFQDRAGTTPVTADGQTVGKILDKSGRGNHAVAPSDAARPILIREPITGVRNLLTYSEDFSNAVWTQTNTSVSAGATGSPDAGTNGTKLIPSVSNGVHWIWSYVHVNAGPGYGTGNAVSIYAKAGDYYKIGLCESINSAVSSMIVDLRDGTTVGAAASTGTTVVTSVGNGWYRITWTPVMTVFTNNAFAISVLPNSAGAGYNIWSGTWAADGTSGLYIWGAQVETGGTSTAYQKVTGRYDVTEAGVVSVRALKFDGVDDSLSTAAINFTSTDKMSVFSGVRNNTTTDLAPIVELSSSFSANNGSFYIGYSEVSSGATLNYLRGSATSGIRLTGNTTIPRTEVGTVMFDIAQSLLADEIKPRINGSVAASAVNYAGPAGTGNFGNYPIYIGRRGGIGTAITGNIYSLIVRGALSTTQEITDTETWVAAKTGVTL